MSSSDGSTGSSVAAAFIAEAFRLDVIVEEVPSVGPAHIRQGKFYINSQ